MLLERKWNQVICAVNAIGNDACHYTIMMLSNGTVLARRHKDVGRRMVLRGHVPPVFRDEETLRYIAYLKGFAVL